MDYRCGNFCMDNEEFERMGEIKVNEQFYCRHLNDEIRYYLNRWQYTSNGLSNKWVCARTLFLFYCINGMCECWKWQRASHSSFGFDFDTCFDSWYFLSCSFFFFISFEFARIVGRQISLRICICTIVHYISEIWIFFGR